MPNLYTLSQIIILSSCAAIAALWLALEFGADFSRWAGERWEGWRKQRGHEKLRRLVRRRYS